MVFFRNDDDSEGEEQAVPTAGRVIPLLPLRDIVVFPHMVVPLFVGRAKSIQALEDAVSGGRELVLSAQKHASQDEPGEDDIYPLGTLGSIIQLLRLPDGTVKVLVEGKTRVKITAFHGSDPYFSCEVEELPDEEIDSAESTALVRTVHSTFENYVKLNKKVPPEVLNSIAAINDPGKLSDTIVAHLNLKLEERQSLLEIIAPLPRLEEVFTRMKAEIEVLEVERKIRGRVKKQMERSQKEYYLNEQMRAIQKELGDRDEFKGEMQELEDQIKAKKMPEEARERVDKEMRKFKMMSPMSAEATVVRNYIDWMIALPWDEYKEEQKDLDVARPSCTRTTSGSTSPRSESSNTSRCSRSSRR